MLSATTVRTPVPRQRGRPVTDPFAPPAASVRGTVTLARPRYSERWRELSLVESELLSRARAGDGAAFRVLTEPHRRELHVHCYRMLGSLQDAEDAYQDTMLSAWRGLASFGERASLRTWLYRIATNRCLSTQRTARRRPAKAWDIPGVDPPDPTSLGEVVW